MTLDYNLIDPMNRAALMEIAEARYEKSLIIITSQIPIYKWHDIIGEQTVADAILDRILHGLHRLELLHEFLRKIENIIQNMVTELD